MAGVLLMPAFVILLALIAVFLFGMALGIKLARVEMPRRNSRHTTEMDWTSPLVHEYLRGQGIQPPGPDTTHTRTYITKGRVW